MLHVAAVDVVDTWIRGFDAPRLRRRLDAIVI
jgi:hypothetical protein